MIRTLYKEQRSRAELFGQGDHWAGDMMKTCEWQKWDQLSDFCSLPFCTRINCVKVTNSWCRSMEQEVPHRVHG